MPITHPFVSAVPDGPTATEVRPTNWNANHLFIAESADPGSPVQGQVWVVLSGTSPTRVAALKIYDGGLIKTIASVTY